MLSRRMVFRSLVVGSALTVAVALWFWRWSPSAYAQRSFLCCEADDVAAAEALLREGIVFHGWFPLSTRDDVTELQLRLLDTYTRSRNIEAIKRYMGTVTVPLERIEILARAHQAVAQDHFAAKRWKESCDSYLTAADTYQRGLAVPVAAVYERSHRSYVLGFASEAAANAAIAASNGRLVEEARGAMENFVNITVRYEFMGNDDTMVDLVEKNPSIRPANFEQLLLKIADRKARAQDARR